MNTSRFKLSCTLAVAGLVLSTATAGTGQANASASIHFKGSSTLHDFEGSVKTEPFSATFQTIASTNLVRLSTTATVNVIDMTTDNKKRDKKMFKMLDQKKFPLVKGTLTNAPLPISGTSKAILRLKIRNVENDVTATLSDWKHEGTQASCRMTFPVSLKAFGLKAPSVMGLIRVGDTVDVECIIQGEGVTEPKDPSE